MDITIKKRIVGFLLLVGITLIIISVFFGRSIPVDELKLSGYVPTPPAKPKDLSLSIPPKSATTPVAPEAIKPEAAQIVPAATSTPAPVFEDISSTPPAEKTDITIQDNPPNLALPETQPAAPAPVAVKPKPAKPTTTQPRTPAIEISDNVRAKDTSSKEAQQIALVSQGEDAKPAPVVIEPAAKPTPVVVEKAVKKPTPKPVITEAAVADSPKKSAIPAGAWVVQLGAFSKTANAEKLVKQLQAQGIPAYSRPAKTAKGNMTKVFAGPTERAEAIQLKTKILQAFNIKGVVVKGG